MPDARQAYQSRGNGESTIGWKLDPDQRKELVQQFPPKFRNLVADHVTLTGGTVEDSPLPHESEGEIIGRADDGRGVEAMVIRIGGTSDRPDGGTYHITWSLEDGREAKESNKVLREQKWETFELPMPVMLHPARWP